ncbi:MAG: replication and repair protein RecF protein [Microgenomates group bacterium GW2011_GWC2_45_8]|nr:MAG: replication and repair protein RecF protein [Microgenomates group bacterium GW2011_GWC2_45_8]
MILTTLSLQNFRSYKKQNFEFSPNTTLIIGNNGVGKTNLLEAIFLLAAGSSFRADKDEQMVLYGQEFGRVTATVGDEELAVVLTKPKRFFVNQVAKRKMDFIGHLRCVLFRPEDIDLILGSPSTRRGYLDFVLEQTDREYRRSSLSYKKGLRQRNKLLERIRENQAERKQLLFWDKLLIRNGEVITNKRTEYLEFVSRKIKKRGMPLRLNYDNSIISELRLEQYENNEVAAGKTLVGPHRDDFNFIYQRSGKLEKDLSLYGSRGEQRMAVLGVKLAELEFMDQSISGEADRPVLLLDDIFSELDHEHREAVLNLLEKQQTIITTTDEHLIPDRYKKKVDKINLC